MLDTEQKRYAMLNFGDGNNFHLMPPPDGTWDQGDRLQGLDLLAFDVVTAIYPDDTALGVIGMSGATDGDLSRKGMSKARALDPTKKGMSRSDTSLGQKTTAGN